MRNGMRSGLLLAALGLLGLGLAAGCSASGAGHTAFNVFKNTKANQLGVTIWVDGSEAKRDELKQAATGFSRWTCSGDITTAPKLKFEFKSPDALGRIRSIIVSIYQKHEANYSDQAEFTIVARSGKPEDNMKPGVEYDLGKLPSDFKITNWKGEEVSAVALKPGWDYMMNFTVSADDSETAQIFYRTKKMAETAK